LHNLKKITFFKDTPKVSWRHDSVMTRRWRKNAAGR